MNKYFECVSMYRNNIGNPISRYLKYYKLKKYLLTVSPSYDDLKDISTFIVILEFAMLYPNILNNKIDDSNLECPIVVDVDKKRITLSTTMNGYKIKTSLCDDESKLISIKIYYGNNDKKIRSEYNFYSGEKLNFNELIGEEHLFITIINSITRSTLKLLDFYCFSFK